jgi:glutamine synthetase
MMKGLEKTEGTNDILYDESPSTEGIPLLEEREPGNVEAIQEVIRLIREKNIRFVDLWFMEMSGRPWRISIRADRVDSRIFSPGVVLDGKTVGGSWHGFIVLHPDPSAFFMDPIAKAPTLALLCDVKALSSAGGNVLDPRQVLKRGEAYLRKSGIASLCVIGAEPEFFLMEGSNASNEDSLREILRSMAAAMNEAGIPVDWFRIGPANGQGRVQMRAAGALRTADQVVMYKHVARNLARTNGKSAVFLPKPLPGDGSAAMLLHHALWRNGLNLFHDAQGWALTSALCRWYAGGILKHAPALLAFTAPTTNSYRRLSMDGAPVEMMLSNNRDIAVCRVPAGTTGPLPDARRIKFCAADSSSNPYLCLAATMMAGIDGIENRIEPHIEEIQGSPAPRLPSSLEESLAALEEDHTFLEKGGVFSAEIIRRWIDDRWKMQVLPMRSRPHPWELYLEETR